ncbi:MAG: AMP-binding protein [Roseobacter sp.]|jgi:fatty-acyl-CoA synthase|nr:AMP-binding protein [Roseobacter sp.]
MRDLGRAPKNGMSHVAGDCSEPLLEETIPQLLRDTAARLPDHEAAVFAQQSVRLTYAQLVEQVDAVAGGLLRLGIAAGDRVGIWSPNRVEWLLTQFATARIGALLVCINPAYRPAELEYALNKVGCHTLIMTSRFKSSDYVAMMQALAPELPAKPAGQVNASRLPALRHIIVMDKTPPAGMLPFDSLMGAASARDRRALDTITDGLSPQDPINIQFTSGTTGNPKGACLTHHNIINNAHFVTRTLELSATDRLCIPVPFYHCFGMVMGTLGCLTKGATMVIPSEGFDAGETLQTVSGEKCTALYGVPTMFVNMLEHPDFGGYDLSSLRSGIMAGAPCPIEVMRQVQSRMNMHQVTIAYGMTETSPVSFQSNIDDPLDKRVSSVGRIHPHVEVRIVDNHDTTVPVGMQGELLTRGYSVMRGYWDDAEQTRASISPDGWMRTGDLATLDPDGYCSITGRVKDMILRGGENIYPREIEEFLYTHPDVSQAQVFGIPDDRLGEVVCAWIVCRPGSSVTARQITDFCRAHIAHYKVPSHVMFRDSLPMTVTGKPQKFIMRDQTIAALATEQV